MATLGLDNGDDDLLLLPELEQFNIEEDPEVLRAALDFIEACDAHDFLSGDDSDASSAHSPSSPAPSELRQEDEEGVKPSDEPKEKPKPRRVTRNRRKEEIAELRVLVAELEKQVAGRKRKLHHVPATLPYALGASSPSEEEPNVDVNVVWEHISKRQQQQRQLAELENAKLRNMVTDQLKIARELTREAKRRAILEGRADPMDDLLEPAHANESPLMVRIYPSRPAMQTRVGLAMPLSSSDGAIKQEYYSQSDAALEGTPVGAAWMSTAVAAEPGPKVATRIAWQSALRQFLKRRRAACCHERVEDILESAISSTDAKKSDKDDEHHARELLYTHRYDEAKSDPVTDATPPTVAAWRANAAWQSPSALLSSLLSPHTKKTVNLRLFRLERGSSSSTDDLDAVTTQLGGLSLRKTVVPPCAATGALQTWHRSSSLQTSACF